MRGRWGFPTSHDPPHLPWTYGCERFFSRKLPAGLRNFLSETHEILRKWGKTFKGQQSPSIWKNLKSGSATTFWCLFSHVFREELCKLLWGGPWKFSPRLLPVNFFENLGDSRSLPSHRKNLKKIMGKGDEIALERTHFCRRILNRFCFLKHSENL